MEKAIKNKENNQVVNGFRTRMAAAKASERKAASDKMLAGTYQFLAAIAVDDQYVRSKDHPTDPNLKKGSVGWRSEILLVFQPVGGTKKVDDIWETIYVSEDGIVTAVPAGTTPAENLTAVEVLAGWTSGLTQIGNLLLFPRKHFEFNVEAKQWLQQGTRESSGTFVDWYKHQTTGASIATACEELSKKSGTLVQLEYSGYRRENGEEKPSAIANMNFVDKDGKVIE